MLYRLDQSLSVSRGTGEVTPRETCTSPRYFLTFSTSNTNKLKAVYLRAPRMGQPRQEEEPSQRDAQQADRVADEEALMRQVQDRGKDARCRVRAPQDRQARQDVPEHAAATHPRCASALARLHTARGEGGGGDALEAEHDREHAEEDEREDAVPEDGRRAVRVDAALGHEVEEAVHGGRADQGHAVDVRELGLARLCVVSVGGSERREGATHEEEEGRKDEAEDERAGEVGVVHDVRVDRPQRVEHRERLLQDVVKVDAELCVE